MRDINAPFRKLERNLEGFWDEVQESEVGGVQEEIASPSELVRFELGLTLLERVAPSETPVGLWAVLSGHEPPDIPLSPSQKKQVDRAKQYLLHLRSFAATERLALKYERVPERLRLFEFRTGGEGFRRKPISICPEREDVYADLLDNPVAYRRRRVQWAQAGVYRFRHHNRFDSVEFADDHLLPHPSQHPLMSGIDRPNRPPLTVSFSELAQTARWMDMEEAKRAEEEIALGIPQQEPSRWEDRFTKRVRLEVWDEASGCYKQSQALTLNGMFHLAGMVSSGKSTLMDILTVWAIQKGLRVAALVGDVVGVLNKASLFARLGISVAPMLGGYNREQHIARLHNAQNSSVPLTQTPHTGFRWISTGCPLDALRHEQKAKPLTVNETPCTRLAPFVETESDDEEPIGPDRERYTCPMYAGCPRHQAQKDAVDAPLWIGTPASFVYTRVDGAVSQEYAHFAEMVFRRADLLLIDEADQVQMQLDTIFSPNQTLVDGNGDGWLNRLELNVATRLNRGGRVKLTQDAVSAWAQTHRVAQTAVDRLYKEAQQNKNISRWINKENSYFTDWILLHQVVEALSGGTQGQRQQNNHPNSAVYDRLSGTINAFIDDPLGERNGETPLSRFAGALLRHRDGAATREELRGWIEENLAPEAALSPEKITIWCRRMEFGLLVAVLQNSVAYLAERWADVETPLGLEDSASGIFHRPPEAYFPLLPEPPMGQVLAFQYIPDGSAGKLRFFRCTAVGRSLMLRFPDLLAQDNIAGPHTLLLSGTSWAGESPTYDVQAPVDGILRAPTNEVEAICNSRFQIRTFSDDNGKPISVSGRQGEERLAALRRIVHQITAVPDGSRGSGSLLDRYLSQISEPDRHRALFLVGSYVEAKETYEYLTTTPGLMKPEEVCFLEADDDTFNAGYQGGALRRGVVHQFSKTGARILIAPLLAVERGHNILTEDGRYAALGAAFFLVRPHPPKDDLGFAIHSINRFAIEHYNNPRFLKACLEQAQRYSQSKSRLFRSDLDAAAREFRRRAYNKWRYLLNLPIIYSTLPPDDKTAMTWSQLVTIWQVIGRLVRGGCQAHVYFCDAAFRSQTPSSSDSEDEDVSSVSTIAPSLLSEMRRVLGEALSIDNQQAPLINGNGQQVELARALYAPLYKALKEMGGI